MHARLISEEEKSENPITQLNISPRLLFAYSSLYERKKKKLSEVVNDEYSDERIQPHFDRLIALANIPKLHDKAKSQQDYLINFSDDDLIMFIDWYKNAGLHAVLYRETFVNLNSIIKKEKNGLVKNILNAIRLFQEGKDVHDVKEIMHSIHRPRDLQHAFHLYNQRGLSYDLNLYSRKGALWFLMRSLSEPFRILGTGTTIMLGYKLLLGSLKSIGINETEYFLCFFFVLIKLSWDFRDAIQGMQDSSDHLGHWVRLSLKSMTDIVLCRTPSVKLWSLTNPVKDNYHGILFALIFVLGTTLLRSKMDDIFSQTFALDESSSPFQRVLEPYLLILPAVSLMLNMLEACREALFPCKECIEKCDDSLELSEVITEEVADKSRISNCPSTLFSAKRNDEESNHRVSSQQSVDDSPVSQLSPSIIERT